MRKNFRGLFIGLCVMSAVSMTACSDKNQNNVTEIPGPLLMSKFLIFI